MGVQYIEGTWQEHAACRGPNQAIFFPPPWFERKIDKRRREMRAKEICAGCAVVGACKHFAIRAREQHGIWGGLTEGERQVELSHAR